MNCWEIVDEQLKIVKPLTKQAIDQLSAKDSFFGTPFEVEDNILFANIISTASKQPKELTAAFVVFSTADFPRLEREYKLVVAGKIPLIALKTMELPNG